MNSSYKTNGYHINQFYRFSSIQFSLQLVSLLDNINFKKSDKYVTLSNLNVYFIWKNVKRSYKNNKSKISALTWNEEIELPDRSYPVSHNQDCC